MRIWSLAASLELKRWASGSARKTIFEFSTQGNHCYEKNKKNEGRSSNFSVHIPILYPLVLLWLSDITYSQYKPLWCKM